MVYYNKDEPQWMYGIEVTDDDKYIILTVVQDTSRVSTTPPQSFHHPSDDERKTQTNLFWIAELEPDSIEKGFKWNKIINKYEAEYD